MDALISGQSGFAVLIQGNDLSFFQVGTEQTETSCSPGAISHLFAGASDVVELKATTRSEAIKQLNFSWRCDRTLQTTLIALDQSEDPSNRELATQCLSFFLEDERVCERVANRLYSAPLPTKIASIPPLTRDTETVRVFFRNLADDQPQIARIIDGWNNLPPSMFESEESKRELREVATESGVFRLLARASNDPAGFGLTTIKCHEVFAGFPNYRKLVGEWLGPLKPRLGPQVVRHDPTRLSGDTADTSDRRRHVAKAGSTYELFENVKRQKSGIVDLLKKGDIVKVRKYASELMTFQVSRGDQEFAAMSLCDLSNEAKLVHNYSLQLELAQKAVEASPEDGWAYGQIADAYFCLGQYDNAFAAFDRAATLGEGAFGKAGKARILRAKGKLDESLAMFEQIILEFPEDSATWCGKAEVLRSMRKLDQALSTYEDATKRFPDERVPLCGQAAVLTDMGRLGEALNAYDQVIASFGDDVVAYCGKADVLKELGRLNQALEVYALAMTKFPEAVIPRSGRADVLNEMGQWNEALDFYSRTAIEFPHELIPLNGQAETLKKMARYDLALAAYDLALARFPEDSRTRNGKAEVLRRVGRLRDSLQNYDENIKRSPYDLVALSGRADVLKELGKFKEAIDAYDVLVARDPTSLRFRNSKAAVLSVMRRYDEALKLLPVGDPQTRDEWVSEHIRAMIHLRRGKHDLAVNILEKGSANVPFAAERKYFEHALAVARLRMRKFRQAISHLADDREPFTKILRIHALGSLHEHGPAREALRSLEVICPPRLVPLKNEIAARFNLSSQPPKHNAEWILEEEWKNGLLEAA